MPPATNEKKKTDATAATTTTTTTTTGTGGGTLRLLVKWVFLPYVAGCILSEFVPAELAQTVIHTILPASLLLTNHSNNLTTATTTTTTTSKFQEEKTQNNNNNNHDNNNKQRSRMATTTTVDDKNEVDADASADSNESPDFCWQRFLQSLEEEELTIVHELMDMEESKQERHGVNLVLHRNGDVEQCGVSPDFLSQLRLTLNSLDECPVAFGKYTVESILTSVFHQIINDCTSKEPDRSETEGFLGFCDMGEANTPILLDHDKLVPVLASPTDYTNPEKNAYLPCHFHSREGVRITSFQKLVSRIVQEYKKMPDSEVECHSIGNDNGKVIQEQEQVCQNPEKEVHLYAVPAGRVFMFAPAFVGEIFDLPHIQGADPTQPVYMKVLSVSPRVFDIFNYFTQEESAGLVAKATAETSESHRIKRSSTGASGYNINTRRTSESGFDTHGAIAQAVKRRCFSVLGFDEYIEGHSDGLQILRYNQTKAYTAHMDWIDDDGKQEHDYNSAGKGGNRFATILLYMTDLGEADGGETVFVNGKPLSGDSPTYKEALEQLRNSEQAALFKRDSWEEKMVARCRSSLAIRPNSARAVLFYSQLPNGQPDPSSLHGGCPVLSSEAKWAANLWVWNTPRAGFAGAPVNEERVAARKKANKEATPSQPSSTPPRKHVTFTNEGGDPAFMDAELYYEDQFWARLGDGDPPQAVNSYEGQVWNIKVKGEIKKTWIVGQDPKQKFTL